MPRFPILLVVVGGALATSTAGAAPNESEGSAPRWGLVIAGGATLGAAYVAPLGAAAASGFRNHAGWFALPIAGPWLYLGTRDGCGREREGAASAISNVGCSFDAAAIVGSILAGVAQITGATLLVAGLVERRSSEPSRQTAHEIRLFSRFTGAERMGGFSISF